MSKLPTSNRHWRAIWTADSYVSSAAFDIWMQLRSWGSAYSDFLSTHFRISGPIRVVIDLIDDFATFGVAASFALLAYALPPLPAGDDIWNKGRQYTITFTDQDGQVIGRRGISQDDTIKLEDIPPTLINATLATEDARFYEHFGVDVIGTLRAIVQNTRSGSRQGGSSITQQVVKNLFLSPERTMRRKVHEAFLSFWVENRLTKNDILKLYLDRAYLGGGNYGVEAASQFYFGKSVRDINLSESSILAGLFKAPSQYAPHAFPDAAQKRSEVVLYRMLDAGFITQGDLLQAKRKPAEIINHDNIAEFPNWFLDYAYQDTLNILSRHGLKNDYVLEVKTTINSKLQTASQAILNDVIDNQGSEMSFNQAASVTMSPDGAMRAIVGGRDYEDSQFNRAISAKRQVGSSFKPFVYLAALENGYTPETKVLDSPVCVGTWCVNNFNNETFGQMSLKTALTRSVNTIAVKLMVDVGRKTVEATARRLGIKGKIDPYPTMSIGTSALTLADLTTGYATIANNGKLAAPYAVLEIRRPTGELVYSHNQNEKDSDQVAEPDKIAQLNEMLSNVVENGTAQRAKLGFEPAAGKTGTNAAYRDAWFVGYTAHHVTGVWVGNDDNTSMNTTKELGVTGGRVPAPTWKRIMSVAEFGLKPEGLLGVALDPNAPPPPTTLPDPVLVGEKDIGDLIALSDSEAATLDPAIAEAAKVDAEAKDVLESIIELVKPVTLVQPKATQKEQSNKGQKAQPNRPLPNKKPPPKKPQPPKQNSFFDFLFGKKQ